MSTPAAHRLLLTVLPSLLVATLVLSTLWGDMGVVGWLRARGDLAEANRELATLERENQRLLRDLALMEQDRVVLERMVAEELQWASPDATLYAFED